MALRKRRKVTPSARRRFNPTKKALMGSKKKSLKKQVRRKRSIAKVKRQR